MSEECMFCGNRNVPQLWERADGIACLPGYEVACRAAYDKRVLAGAERLREERDAAIARAEKAEAALAIVQNVLAEERAAEKADVARLREALEAADSVMWMAAQYAEAGGTHGPESRDFEAALETIKAALAATDPAGRKT